MNALDGLARATQTRLPPAFAALTQGSISSVRADGVYAKTAQRVEVGPLAGSLCGTVGVDQVGLDCLLGFPANGQPWLVSL